MSSSSAAAKLVRYLIVNRPKVFLMATFLIQFNKYLAGLLKYSEAFTLPAASYAELLIVPSLPSFIYNLVDPSSVP